MIWIIEVILLGIAIYLAKTIPKDASEVISDEIGKNLNKLKEGD